MGTDFHTNKLTSYLKTFFIALTILFASCSTNSSEKNYLHEMGIDLADKFQIISSENSASIGDFTAEFKLKLSDKDYQTIKNKIQYMDNFQILKENESPNRSYSGPNKEIEITAWKKNETYTYEIKKNRTSGYEIYILQLLPDNLLTLQYVDE